MKWLQILIIIFLLELDLNTSAETWKGCGRSIFSKCSNGMCLKTARSNTKHIPGMMVASYYKHIVFYCGLNYKLIGRSYFECNVIDDILIETDEYPSCVPLFQNHTDLNSTLDSPVDENVSSYFNQCIVSIVAIIVLIIILIVVILSFFFYIRRLQRELRMEQTFRIENARRDTEVCLPIVPPRPPETFLELVADQNDYGYLESKSSVTSTPAASRVEAVQYDEVRSSVQYDDAYGESHYNRDRNVDDQP